MRSYGDRCGAARALDLVGERWALLVVRELLFGPKRFTDLRVGLPKLSPDVLAQRLRELEDAGVVQRRKLGPPAGSRVYELTDRGRELEVVLMDLARWGSREAFPDEAPDLSPDALALALRTLFSPSAAAGFSATCELRLAEDSFTVAVEDARLDLVHGSVAQPDIVIDTDPGTFGGLLWHGRRLTDAIRRGDLVLTGERRVAARLLELFPAPVGVRG